MLDVLGIDGDDDLGVIGQLGQHAHLGVRLKAGKHAARMIVIEELAAKLQVELAAELPNPLADVSRLHLDVFVVVETDPHATSLRTARNTRRWRP